MFNLNSGAKMRLVATALILIGILLPESASASINYGYDQLGRLVTALYDNGACVLYVYDPAGNRTSQTITISSSPETPTWGTGTWGCFNWTPQ